MKQFLKQLVPPILSNVGAQVTNRAGQFFYSNKKFRSWWERFKTRSNLDSDLVTMVDCFLATDGFEDMSRYWNYLNKKNLEQLSRDGIENFKQTVATNYYTFVDGITGGLGANFLRDIDKYNVSVPVSQIARKHDFLDVDQSILFNTMTALLYDYVATEFPDMLDDCEEGTIGNPLSIRINGKSVSQDSLSSAIEYMSVITGRQAVPQTVLEIGAGSGRTAEVFIRKHADIRYVICDIVPALFISQSYLSQGFENKRIFKFRDFKTYADVADDFENSDIAFIMPHQARLFPDRSFDTCMAIDCLHEMKEEQIGRYFKVADRLADYFYFKAWKSTDVPFDNIRLTEDKYVPLPTWTQILKQDCYVPSDFFEAMYRCRP